MSALTGIVAALGGKPNGSGYKGFCPCHSDQNPSLTISETADGKVLLHCHATCSQDELIDWARSRGFDLSGGRSNGNGHAAGRFAAEYDYRDSDGNVRYQVVRRWPKAFQQRQPDGNGGWIWKMSGVEPLPYRLPEMLAAPDKPVFVVEGEKDADRLEKEGLLATTNHGGAGKWRTELCRWFKDRNIVVLPDNDDAGRKHAEDVARKLHGIAKRICIVELPDLPQKGDASDWLDAGHTVRDLRRLAHNAPAWEPADTAAEPERPDDIEDQPPRYSDEAMALRFSAKHADDVRFIAAWGQWMHWMGARWSPDRTLRTFDLARAIARAASAEITDPKRQKLAAAIASARTVAAIVSLSRADRRHATTVEQWDADLWSLGTEHGDKLTVDLRTGTCRPARREDCITKSIAAAPGGDCPRWRKFLGEITAEDAELEAYLQRVAGYCLTGVTSEHALFFCYGTGANGKSVFIKTLAGIWNDYAVTAPMETFVASHNDHHPTDVAGLRGARLVVAHETERGRRWAESKIKVMTGGDAISARFMRQDFFVFIPQFKLLIAGNHKPGFRGVDEAIRRRFHLIPFNVTIPEEQRDRDLFDKLRDEWGGILQWAIEGCIEWQRIGLAPPPAVRNATETYLASEDAIANWLDECCEQGKGAEAGRSKLFESWKAWAEKTGEHPGAAKDFFAAIEGRGFAQFKSPKGTRMFRGLRLLPEEPEVRCG